MNRVSHALIEICTRGIYGNSHADEVQEANFR